MVCQFGIIVCYYDLMIGVGIVDLMCYNMKFVWFEVFGLVMMEVFDCIVIVGVVCKVGVIIVIDNIWSGGVYYQLFEYGIDIFVQVLIKY